VSMLSAARAFSAIDHLAIRLKLSLSFRRPY
jgi:hypothetical protein